MAVVWVCVAALLVSAAALTFDLPPETEKVRKHK
jgi:hypothetical protein